MGLPLKYCSEPFDLNVTAQSPENDALIGLIQDRASLFVASPVHISPDKSGADFVVRVAARLLKDPEISIDRETKPRVRRLRS